MSYIEAKRVRESVNTKVATSPDGIEILKPGTPYPFAGLVSGKGLRGERTGNITVKVTRDGTDAQVSVVRELSFFRRLLGKKGSEYKVIEEMKGPITVRKEVLPGVYRKTVISVRATSR